MSDKVLISNKFLGTVTDETDPETKIESNFTENSYENYATATVTITPGSATSWVDDTESTVIDLSSAGRLARYIVLKSNAPAYLWLGRQPVRDIDGHIIENISAGGFPKTGLNRLMVLDGSTDRIYAINPSRTTDPTPLTVKIRVVYVY